MTPESVTMIILRAALAKLDECRAKCPGVGGDIDAMNLRYLIDRRELDRSAVEQAADRLKYLSVALNVEVADELDALIFLLR